MERQVIIEGPGHVPMHMIKENMEEQLERRLQMQEAAFRFQSQGGFHGQRKTRRLPG